MRTIKAERKSAAPELEAKPAIYFRTAVGSILELMAQLRDILQSLGLPSDKLGMHPRATETFERHCTDYPKVDDDRVPTPKERARLLASQNEVINTANAVVDLGKEVQAAIYGKTDACEIAYRWNFTMEQLRKFDERILSADPGCLSCFAGLRTQTIHMLRTYNRESGTRNGPALRSYVISHNQAPPRASSASKVSRAPDHSALAQGLVYAAAVGLGFVGTFLFLAATEGLRRNLAERRQLRRSQVPYID